MATKKSLGWGCISSVVFISRAGQIGRKFLTFCKEDIKNQTWENCYLKNIYHPADNPLCAKFPKEQTNENWNLTLIKVSVFYFLNENYFEWIITNYWIGLLYDLKYYVDQTHPHPNIANIIILPILA